MSSTVINAVCGIVRASCEVVDVIKDTYNICTQPADLLALRVARIFTRLAGLTAYGCEIGALNSDASNSTLFAIKASEVVVRVIDVPVQVGLVTAEMMQQDMPSLEFIEKAVLQPALSMMRAKNEMLIYQEKNFLSMSPKQQATQTRLVEVKSGFMTTQLVPMPITVEESQKILTQCENEAPSLNVAEAIVKTGLASKLSEATAKGFEFCEDIYARLSTYDALVNRLQAVNARAEDPFNLLALDSIPTELHGDRVFRELICPITLNPIRHPVGDPNGITVYERSAIETQIRLQERNIYHEPLCEEQLVEKPQLVERINDRLQFHMQRLRQYAAAGLNS